MLFVPLKLKVDRVPKLKPGRLITLYRSPAPVMSVIVTGEAESHATVSQLLTQLDVSDEKSTSVYPIKRTARPAGVQVAGRVPVDADE